jgi:transposase
VGFIGGSQRSQFVDKVKDLDRSRVLAAPIDVGKHSAAALVCDFWGEIVVAPYEFELNERGFAELRTELARAEAGRDACWMRVGLEQAGHYHDALHARLHAGGIDVAVLNPAQVKENRSQDLLRSLKSDVRDLGAMAELLIRGKGRETPTRRRRPVAPDRVGRTPPPQGQGAYGAQEPGAVHPRPGPGLDGCFADILDTKLGRLLLAEAMTPERVSRLGPDRLRAFAARRGVVVSRRKAEEVVDAGRAAFRLPKQRAGALLEVLRDDVRLLGSLQAAIDRVEAGLAEVLPATPAAVLLSMPHVGVVRASAYGAALGDPGRFSTAAQVYRMSGLVPRLHASAGRTRRGTSISREGKVELREAILELGKALRHGHPDFRAYAASLKERGKLGGVIACALGNRANRVAFAMIRDQRLFAAECWPKRRGRAPHGRLASTRPKSPVRDHTLPPTDLRGD